MSSRTVFSCVSPVGLVALVLLPFAVWICARLWWFNVGETELGDLHDFCELMPPLLTIAAALFSFFMLPPWRAAQRGAGAWLRRLVAFASLAFAAFVVEARACCCCVGYCEWAVPLLFLSLLGAGVSLLTALFLLLRTACRGKKKTV